MIDRPPIHNSARGGIRKEDLVSSERKGGLGEREGRLGKRELRERSGKEEYPQLHRDQGAGNKRPKSRLDQESAKWCLFHHVDDHDESDCTRSGFGITNNQWWDLETHWRTPGRPPATIRNVVELMDNLDIWTTWMNQRKDWVVSRDRKIQFLLSEVVSRDVDNMLYAQIRHVIDKACILTDRYLWDLREVYIQDMFSLALRKMTDRYRNNQKLQKMFPDIQPYERGRIISMIQYVRGPPEIGARDLNSILEKLRGMASDYDRTMHDIDSEISMLVYGRNLDRQVIDALNSIMEYKVQTVTPESGRHAIHMFKWSELGKLQREQAW